MTPVNYTELCYQSILYSHAELNYFHFQKWHSTLFDVPWFPNKSFYPRNNYTPCASTNSEKLRQSRYYDHNYVQTSKEK